MPGFRLREAQRPTYSPLDAGPHIDVCALDFLGVLLTHLMLLGREMPNGANSCCSCRKTSSLRRPNTYATTLPV
jgi:hypothetical protein